MLSRFHLTQWRYLLLLPLIAALTACNTVVLNPSGDIALQQRDLLVRSTVLMLLIIVPVMVLTVLFAWRYRQSNKDAHYDPDWHHSTRLELVIWAAPLLIVICLGALTWLGTHLLDPYRYLGRIAPGKPITQEAKPLQVNVVALDWKWLFIYPEYGFATVNEMAVPVNRPIAMRITSSSVMNSLYIPALAGQVYAMPSMETKLHGVLNKPGVSEGFSANYSGAGFSGMKFKFHGLSDPAFDRWVKDIQDGEGALTREKYLELERPTENEPVRRYAKIDAGLYKAILNRCVEPGKMCMHDMMAIDAKGGLGLASIYNVAPLSYDKYARRGAVFGSQQAAFVTNICTIDESMQTPVVQRPPRISDSAPLVGAGLTPPPTFGSSDASQFTARRSQD
jgi:cytochrome o ubiquinol oxidase subunit 2